MAKPRYYVEAETRKGQVVAYNVLDCIGGMASVHATYEVTADRSAAVALHLANLDRDDRNNGIV